MGSSSLHDYLKPSTLTSFELKGELVGRFAPEEVPQGILGNHRLGKEPQGYSFQTKASGIGIQEGNHWLGPRIVENRSLRLEKTLKEFDNPED